MLMLIFDHRSPVRAAGGIAPLASAGGFTLMEVLVATAITGIALGVVMSLLAQGHRQAYRGDVSRTAAAVATQLIDDWQTKGKFPSAEEGESKEFSGWSYSLKSGPLSTRVTLPSGDVRDVEPDKLVAVHLRITPPGKGRTFGLTMWVPKAQVED
jgi:prepilin-type N-terminal cleavage/methylation domain-containing protein